MKTARAGLFATVAWLAACEGLTGSARTVYQRCGPWDTCAATTPCASVPVMAADAGTGSLCTRSCTGSVECPAVPGMPSRGLVCLLTGGRGQCLPACETIADGGVGCPSGLSCATAPSGQRVCVPDPSRDE